jgi:hypothetical protein
MMPRGKRKEAAPLAIRDLPEDFVSLSWVQQLEWLIRIESDLLAEARKRGDVRLSLQILRQHNKLFRLLDAARKREEKPGR